MRDLRTLLRSLLLVILLGWLGIAQPAEAQQTVTLSGRVTDTAGQAVSGATVYLHRLPGFVFIDGQDTDGNGAYRFSVAPGTYSLQADTPGPFIAQRQELTLATDTTRNIVLESGVDAVGAGDWLHRPAGALGLPVRPERRWARGRFWRDKRWLLQSGGACGDLSDSGV